MPYRATKKSVRTKASRMGMGSGRVRYRRSSAYGRIMRIPRPLSTNARSVYKYSQWQFPTYLSKQPVDPAGTLLSSNLNCVQLGIMQPDSNLIGYNMIGGAITFRLNNINGVTAFTQMYDQYRINGAKVVFTPQFSDSPLFSTGTSGGAAVATSTAALPQLTIARDWDDTVVPASEFELLERQDVQTSRLNDPRSYYMKTKVRMLGSLDGTTTTNTIVGTGNEWVDCSNSGTVYPGIKFYLRNLLLPAAATWSVRVDVKLYIEFRNVR